MPIGYFSSFHALANVITRRRKVSLFLLVKCSIYGQWEMALPYSVVQIPQLTISISVVESVLVNLWTSIQGFGIDILSLSQLIRVQDPFISSNKPRSRDGNNRQSNRRAFCLIKRSQINRGNNTRPTKTSPGNTKLGEVNGIASPATKINSNRWKQQRVSIESPKSEFYYHPYEK